VEDLLQTKEMVETAGLEEALDHQPGYLGRVPQDRVLTVRLRSMEPEVEHHRLDIMELHRQ
jgi:predicted ABC-type transport system involved in lysophospholipase L1 biosynthesis ATPase subunit